MRPLSQRSVLFLALWLLLPCASWAAQTEEPVTPVAVADPSPQEEELPEVPENFPTTEELEQIFTEMQAQIEDAYFDVAPGFDVENTAEAAPSLSATSRIARAWDLFGPPSPETSWCSFTVFDGKGEWSETEDAKNHAEAALSGTIHNCKVRRDEVSGAFSAPKVVFGITGDLRSKWGTFENGEGEQRTTVEGNQVLLGGGLVMEVLSAPKWLEVEEIMAGYYHVLDAEGDLPVPEDLDVDHLQGRLKFRVQPFIDKADSPLHGLALVADGRVSWALDGPDEGEDEYYASLALEMGRDKTAATLRWETGEEAGFEYDQRLVLGVLFRLFGIAGSDGN